MGSAGPKAAPHSSQNACPGSTGAPQTGQVVDAAGTGAASSSLAPHSSQKTAPLGCQEWQFGHIDIV